MIHISCSLPEPGSFWWDSWDKPQLGDPATIAEIDLRYKCFDVNAEMIVNGVEFVSKNGFVTLVDLALSIRGVTERLSRGDEACGFTEWSEVIHLRRTGESIVISSSEKLKRASAARAQLLAQFLDFLRSAHSRLVEEIPMTENAIHSY